MKCKPFVILLILMAYGFFLRIYNLGNQSLWIDECYSITAAAGMMENLVPHMPSGVLYLRGILHTSMVSLSMSLLGINEFSARLPSVIFGVLTMAIVYLFSKRMFNERVSLLTALVVTFSVVETAWSRQARMYQQLQFFYILSLYAFHRYLKNRRKKFGILTAISVLAAGLSHSLGFSLLIIIPLYVLLLNIKTLRNADLKNILTERRTILAISLLIAGLFLAKWFSGAFTYVLSTRMDYSQQYLRYLKTFFPVFLYLSVIGAVVAFRENWRDSLLPILALVIPLPFISFGIKLLGYRYIFFIIPLMFMFFSKSLDWVTRFLAGNRERIQNILFILLCVLILLVPGMNAIPTDTYYLEPNAPQPDFNSVYDYLNENRNPGDILISSYPEIALWFNQTPDYWLAFAISGFSPERWMDGTRIYYKRTMTPAIKNFDDLKNVIETSESGWIVIDSLAGSRIPKSYWRILKEKTEWVDKASKPGFAGAVNLYRWGE